MSLTRKIAHNTIYQLIGKLISTVLGIIVVVLLTRYLGAEQYGQYTTVIAFLQIFSVIVDLGLYIILIKKISEPDADTEKLVSNVFTIRLLSAILFLGAAPIVALALPYPSIIKIGIAITSISYLFITLNQVLTGLFQKNLRMDKVSIAEVAGRIVLLASIGLILLFQLQLSWVFVAMILGSLTNFLYIWLSARRFVRIRLSFNWPVWINIIRESWPIGLSVAFNLVYFKADTIILSLYQPAADVGIYGATYKVLEIMITLPAMFAGLVMPLLTAAYAMRNTDQFQHVIQKSFNFLLILSLPLIFGTQFVAQNIMLMVAGEEFSASGSVLQILIIATGIIFIGSLFGNTVVAVNKQKPMILIYLFIAIVSLAGYLILIPRYTYYGAAWMTVASELMIMIGSIWMVYRATKFRLNFNVAWRTIVSVAVMSGLMYLLRDLSWYWLVVIGCLVYIGVLVMVKGITRTDIKDVLSLKQ